MKFINGFSDGAYLLLISVVDLDNWIKVISAIVIGGLMAVSKVYDIIIKSKETKLKQLEIDEKESN